MKPERFSSPTDAYNPSLVKQACLLGGISLFGGVAAMLATPVQAQTEVEITAPTPVESVPPPAPVETSAELLLRPQVSTAPAVEPIAPASEPVFESAPAPAAPVVETPAAGPEVVVETRENPASAVIDPTDYGLGATRSLDNPAIVFSDRSTGCQFTLQQGQATPSRTCSPTGRPAEAGTLAQGDGAPGADGSAGSFSVGPVSFGGNGVSIGGTTVISREYFNAQLRPLNLLRRGAEEFVFPLAIPAQITSLFGWRTHPIFGDMRFHSGTDLGAPEGTPVLAAKDGEVHLADFAGGYGLMVVLRHDDSSLETRYAHLSQILVRPGEKVKQGDVVGLVGSTGNSTGPHLHFELRELTAQGWVLTNPNELMNLTLANFVDAINNPLLALGLAGKAEANAETTSKDLLNLPYRPAQPNAN